MTRLNYDPDRLATVIAGMTRAEVKREILQFDAGFKLDFPEDYLDKLSVERLRHILLAAYLQKGHSN